MATDNKPNLNEFIYQLIGCIGDISPLINNINQSISDAINPASSVSENISKVSEANELATIDIMNMLDDTSAKCESALESLSKLKILTLEHDVKFTKTLMVLLKKKDYKKVELLVTKKNEILESNNTANLVKSIEVAFNTTIQNAQGIMMALQVQDITTQQLAAIDHTVQTVQSKLNNIINMSSNFDPSQGLSASLEDLDSISENISHLHREVVFDPNAIDNMSQGNTQTDIDDIMKEFQKGDDAKATEDKDKKDEAAIDEDFDMDDLDALFAGK